jgi:hypothetical protein
MGTEALLYGGAALGALLSLAGVVFLARRVRGHKSETDLAGFGRITTTHYGVALVFAGAAMIAQSVSGLGQRDELRATVDRLKRSEGMLVAFVSPSLLSEPGFRSYVSAASPELREAIVRRAMDMLNPEFHRVTDAKPSGFGDDDFAAMRAIYDFLLADDPRNGSALYYKGEVHRVLKQPFVMREYFNAYLTQAPGPGGRLPGVKGLQYFDERTARVHHLLANDYLCEALQAALLRSDMRPDLKMVLAEVEGVRKYRRDGFTASETMLSTEMLEKAALKGTGGMARLRCPARPSARQD